METKITEIKEARTASDIAVARELFSEYADSIDVDLEYQGFASELAKLPGQYAPPSGELFIAYAGDTAAACIALRGLSPTVAEVKRLFVRPFMRGTGLGKELIRIAIDTARARHYRELRLDTLASMGPAQNLYKSFGFAEIEPYSFNYPPGTKFYALLLAA